VGERSDKNHRTSNENRGVFSFDLPSKDSKTEANRPEGMDTPRRGKRSEENCRKGCKKSSYI